MSEWPSSRRSWRRVIINPQLPPHPYGDMNIGSRGGYPGTFGATPAANRATFVPFIVEYPMTIFQLGLYNGAVAGNVDVGVYSWPGSGTTLTRLVSAGSTAMAGAEQIQMFNVADVNLSPALYFLAFVSSTTTTATFRRSQLTAAGMQAAGVVQKTEALPLPETVTMARPETNFVPVVFGLGRELA